MLTFAFCQILLTPSTSREWLSVPRSSSHLEARVLQYNRLFAFVPWFVVSCSEILLKMTGGVLFNQKIPNQDSRVHSSEYYITDHVLWRLQLKRKNGAKS